MSHRSEIFLRILLNLKVNFCAISCSKISDNSKGYVYSEVFFAENAD